jgi:hypothetical protein
MNFCLKTIFVLKTIFAGANCRSSCGDDEVPITRLNLVGWRRRKPIRLRVNKQTIRQLHVRRRSGSGSLLVKNDLQLQIFSKYHLIDFNWYFHQSGRQGANFEQETEKSVPLHKVA